MDSNRARKKRRALMAEMVKRRVRTRAQQLYDDRGKEEGKALEDWIQAESEILDNSRLGPLYRLVKTGTLLSEAELPVTPSEDSSSDSNTVLENA